MNSSTKRVSLWSCAALAGGLGVAATASALSMTDLAQGYALATQATPKTDAKTAEGKCGEGKCGSTHTQPAAKQPAEGKCGEGKCGADKAKPVPKPAPKPTADKKGSEGKCGEGKCGAQH